MEISFLGGAREVGRSCLLVEGMQNTLLDCGVKLEEKEEYPLLEHHAIRKINRVVVSHAHLDHSAYAPALYAAGYRGPVILTKPTRDLMQLLLADYLRINKGASPYSEQDVAKLLKHTQILEIGEWSDRGRGIVRLQESGHILGSAMTELRDEKKVLYTSDINTRSSRLLEGATRGLEADILIIESTYGSKKDRHASAKEASQKLVKSIRESLDKGGKVIIPTFAIGRGQEILFTLESHIRSGALPRVPIYLDGMINKALRIYRHNAVYLKKEVQRRILTSDDDPFKSPYYLVPERKDRSDVFEQEKAIILATSGMLNGGPVLTYLEHLGGDKKNKVILVGYQAEGTRGRALLDGAKELELDGKTIDIKLKVDQAPFSGHSDYQELVEFARTVKGVETVFIVHGEEQKPFELAKGIEDVFKHSVDVIVPSLGETVRV
ncbi:MAG: MBL fold metallo-hydrolase [Candidatus Micrarchaeota archaeon]|nr:MBL fold metallo-hydrolase [Candidatus Micrarchaeota archaeon]